MKCKNCGKEKGLHQAKTLNCPYGTKTRIGYTSFHPTDKFVPKSNKEEKGFVL